MTSDRIKTSFSLVTCRQSPVTALLWFVSRRGCLFVCDPRDEEAKPVFGRFEDGDADARRAVDGRSDADDARGRFDGCAVGFVRAQVELIAAIDFLIEMKERAVGGDVVGFGRLAPSR